MLFRGTYTRQAPLYSLLPCCYCIFKSCNFLLRATKSGASKRPRNRTYERTGRVVKCYRIPDWTRPEEREELPLFTIALETEYHAKNLIKDIYCGEYTGG